MILFSRYQDVRSKFPSCAEFVRKRSLLLDIQRLRYAWQPANILGAMGTKKIFLFFFVGMKFISFLFVAQEGVLIHSGISTHCLHTTVSIL